MTSDDERLARRGARFSDLLARADAPSRPVAFPADRVARAVRRARVVRWGSVAAVALVALGVAGVAPVRAWIAGAARVAWAMVSGAPAPAPAIRVAPGPAPLAPPAVGAVTVPVGGVFTLTVARRQASGTLSLLVEDRQTVSAEVSGESGGAEIEVRDAGIRIENRADANGRYVVKVPARLARVVVQIGREAPHALRVTPSLRWDADLAVRTGKTRALDR
jgi:hypothetical protein